MTIEKLTFENDRNGDTKTKPAAASQNIFRAVVRRAESMGMKVNTEKTQLMVVSDALSFNPEAVVWDQNDVEMRSGTKMKVLGFHMDRPTVAAHVEAIRTDSDRSTGYCFTSRGTDSTMRISVRSIGTSSDRWPTTAALYITPC